MLLQLVDMGGGAVLRGIARIVEAGGTTIHRVGAAVNSAAQISWWNADKAALKQNITPVSHTVDHETVYSSFHSVYDNPDSVEVSNIQETKGTSYENLDNRVETELHQDNDKMLQKCGHSKVIEAFNLLQGNPAIQGMVASLASDKAFLDAMLKNEKVLEFRQSLLEGQSEVSDVNKPSCDHKNPFTEAIKNIKVKVVECTQKITEVCNQFSGFADTFLEKDGDFVDRVLKASSMLGIAILMIFLFKRV